VIHGIHYALLPDEGGREQLGAEEDEDEHEGEAVQNALAGAAAAKTGGTFRQVGPSLPSFGVCVAAAASLLCKHSCDVHTSGLFPCNHWTALKFTDLQQLVLLVLLQAKMLLLSLHTMYVLRFLFAAPATTVNSLLLHCCTHSA